MQKQVDSFLGIASSLPTAYRPYVDYDQSCCALHQPTNVVEGDIGCSEWKLGSHRSVVAVNQTGVKYCHTEVGQRILDGRLFTMVANDSKLASFRDGVPNRFIKKFASGYPVGLHVYGSGYCYLGLIAVKARSRVARCLGPLPFLADVIRFALVVGDHSMPVSVVKVQNSGAMHLERDAVTGLGYDKLIDVFIKRLAIDPFIRIGAGDGFLQEVGDVIGGDRLVGSGMLFDDGDHGGVALIDNITNRQDLMVGKVYCHVCKFWVNPSGHDSRCVVPSVHAKRDQDLVMWSPLRRHAWIGDAYLSADIRCGLLYLHVQPDMLGCEFQRFTSDKEIAGYWDLLSVKDKYNGSLLLPNGDSVKQRATAFEANYVGVLRRDYLAMVFPGWEDFIIGYNGVDAT